MQARALFVILLSVSFLAACGKKQASEDPPSATESKTKTPTTPKPEVKKPAAPVPTGPLTDAELAEAKAFFGTNCASCHGNSGKGDGAAAAALNPKPRNYTDAAWQKTVTDEKILKVIMEGGAANGMSALMTAWGPMLKTKPRLQKGLVAYIRSFAAPAK